MYTLFSWCSDCRADADFELVADTMAPESRAAEYACQECGAAIVVPHVTAQWAFRAEHDLRHQPGREPGWHDARVA